MSPLVRKELRSILPPWCLAMLLATLPVWIVWPGGRGIFASNPGYLVYVPYALGVLLLSLTPFGQELNWGTFSILLAQPLSRTRIWRVKTVLLGVALLVVSIAFFLSNYVRVDSVMETARRTVWHNFASRLGSDSYLQRMIADTRHEVFWGSLMVGGLGALAGFAGGLWTTLLFRQVSAAFWFTLLVPLALNLLAGQVFGIFSDTAALAGTSAVLALYSGAGFVWARNRFLHVQDTQWTGGVVSLPSWSGAAAQPRLNIGNRKRRALQALLSKEFQAQSINLLLAGGLLLIHIAVLALRKWCASYLAVHRATSMTLESFPVLWLAMPLLVGSVAIAEERKLGTLETISCIPISRWLQFSIKLTVALVLGFSFGAVVPLALEHLGSLVGLPPNGSLTLGPDVLPLAILPMLALLLVAGFGITVLAFYASSLSRNTLQALGVGVLACVICALLVVLAAHPPTLGDTYVCGARLLALILTPVMVLALIALAYRNYRRLQLSATALQRNGLVLLMTLLGATAVSSAVYHRFWEVWLPLEPPHSFLAGEGRHLRVAAPKVQGSLSRMAALLPDGRLWLRQRLVEIRKVVVGQSTYFFPQPKGRMHTGFVPGSNWRDIAVSGMGSFAIKAGGSLWDLSKVQPGTSSAESSIKRVGDSRKWTKITVGWQHYCGLRSDGTLWEWGYRMVPAGRQGTFEYLADPTQVGTDTDWVATANFAEGSVAIKADGTIWRWGRFQHWVNGSPAQTEVSAQPKRWLAFPDEQRPVSISFNGNAVAAVCDDGSLWVGGHLLYGLIGAEVAHRANTEMVRWGNESDWKQVEFLGQLAAIGVKHDGSLWSWSIGHVMWFRQNRLAPQELLSKYPVWTSICPYDTAFLALGRDDTLCLWSDPEAGRYEGGGDPSLLYFDFNHPDHGRLLLPSRIHAREIANLAP